MKRLFLIIGLCIPLWLMAQQRSVNEAAQLAADFMQQHYAQAPQRRTACTASSFILSHTRAKLNSNTPAFYVFNQIGDGFVVVSADDRTEDVLMYSEEGQLDLDNANPNVLFWLNRLQEEITAVNDENAVDKSPVRKADVVTAISPLLKNNQGQAIKWDQSSPYYNQCPKDGSQFSMTGCVATATAQVMYKWRHPLRGTGSHKYTTKTQRIQVSQDFSQVSFDWDNMLPSYAGQKPTTDQQNAVAWLMRCCGVACNMDYTADGSGALTDYMANGLELYLGYTFDKFVTMYSKLEYGAVAVADARCHWKAQVSDFETYFNADLEAGRPIIMGGEDSEEGGHEFVCDGRDANGKFHINWGWEGESNCYCALSSLKPSGTAYKFSNHLDAIIGLRPVVQDTIHVTGISVSPSAKTLKINEKVTLLATISPSNATIKEVMWSSDNYPVASVTSKGVVTGFSAGTAHVSATTKDGHKIAVATITVTNEVAPTETFKWVSDICKLKAGDEMILVTTYKGKSYAMNNTITQGFRTNYAGTEMVEIEDSTITLEDDSQAAIYLLAESSGQWTLRETSSGNLLGASDLKMIQSGEGSQSWTISIDTDGQATIQNSKSNYGKLLYNDYSGTPRYSTYSAASATILLPAIFSRKRMDEPDEIELVVDGRSRLTGKKVAINGQLYILRGDRIYNAQGQLVR